MKQTVAPWRSIASSSLSGAPCSSSTVAAPTRIGNVTRPPRPNVNAIGGEPMKTSSLARAHDLARERVADREHVAVEVHRALRPAGRAAGEGDQHDVVARPCRTASKPVRLAPRRAPSTSDERARAGRRLPRARRAAGRRTARRRSRRASMISCELLAAQQRHRRDHDAARLGDGEPAGHHHGRVRRAQQHAVAAARGRVVDQHVAMRSTFASQLAVGQRLGVGDERGPIAVPRARPCRRAARPRS